MLGLGIYNVSEDYEYTYQDAVITQVFTDESDNVEQPGARFGGKLGAGATYMVSPTFGLGLRRTSTTRRWTRTSSASRKYWGFRGRVSYHIMK